MKIGTIIIALIAVGLVIGGIWYFSFKDSNQAYPVGTNNVNNIGTTAPSAETGEGEQQTVETPKIYDAKIRGFSFQPSLLTINVGDTVAWTNEDSVSHTVTSDSGSELDSQTLGEGGSYSHTFTTPGTYSYHCSPHSYMKGKIVVQ